MNRQKLIAILETYRPGQGLEDDPEVQNALKLAASDPAISRLHQEINTFDEVFAEKLRETETPEDLLFRILAAQKATKTTVTPDPEQQDRSKPFGWWFHPAAFGAAAAITILLALSFTFWNRPGSDLPQLTIDQDPVSNAAHSLYASLNPAFRSRQGSEIQGYLRAKGNGIPASLPGGIAWDESFACDVVEINGSKVSIVCFRAPDKSKSMHLFTFHRSDFPGIDLPLQPNVRQDGRAYCATWGNEEQIHVLYSDKGKDNLIAVLDI